MERRLINKIVQAMELEVDKGARVYNEAVV